jgi:hypothetical protein
MVDLLGITLNFYIYVTVVFALAILLYSSLLIGSIYQLIRMRIFKNSVNPLFMFYIFTSLCSICMLEMFIPSPPGGWN